MTFKTAKGGFVPLPTVLRHSLFLFSTRGWEIYCYILMRTGPAGVAWMSSSDISFDLDFKSRPKLRLYIQELVDNGWVEHQRSRGKDYFAIRDPLAVLNELNQKNRIPEEHLEAINEMLESFSMEPIGDEEG